MQKKKYFLFFNIKKDYLNLIWSQNFASVISPAYHSRPNSQEKAKTHAHALVQNRGRGKQGALWAILLSPGGGGGVYSLVGTCCTVLQILTLFQTKRCQFPHPFSDVEEVTRRNITCLHKTEIMSPLLRLERQQRDFLKSISNSHIRLSFVPRKKLKRRTQSIHSRSSFVNHTRLQIRIGKIYTSFQTNTEQKPYPLE